MPFFLSTLVLLLNLALTYAITPRSIPFGVFELKTSCLYNLRVVLCLQFVAQS